MNTACSGWRDCLCHNKRELNTGRYSTYLCKYICSYFSLSLSSSSIAISHGYYRPAQPVRPLCEHSGVKVEREREFDRQKENERDWDKQEAVGSESDSLRQHLQHRHLSKIHPVSAYAHWIWNTYGHTVPNSTTLEQIHTATQFTADQHTDTQSASLFTVVLHISKEGFFVCVKNVNINSDLCFSTLGHR